MAYGELAYMVKRRMAKMTIANWHITKQEKAKWHRIPGSDNAKRTIRSRLAWMGCTLNHVRTEWKFWGTVKCYGSLRDWFGAKHFWTRLGRVMFWLLGLGTHSKGRQFFQFLSNRVKKYPDQPFIFCGSEVFLGCAISISHAKLYLLWGQTLRVSIMLSYFNKLRCEGQNFRE